MIRSSLLAASTLGFAATLAVGQPASAQTAPPTPTAGGAAGGMTMDQFVARQTARIMAADSDGDGRISRAEMAAMPAKGERDPARRFDAMDSNHDGYIDKDEIRVALEKRFHRMDRNGDGILTPDERMAGRREQPAPAAMSAPAQP